MTAIVAALAPVFLVILLGHAFARTGWLGDPFWRSAEGLVYYLLLPALLFLRLADAEAAAVGWGPMAGALVLAVLAVAGALIALKPWLGLTGSAFTSVLQGAIRVNVTIGLTGAAALYGTHGLTLAAIAIAAIIPLSNVVSVAVLTVHGGDGSERAGHRALALELARNPIILACGLGVLANGLDVFPPPPLAATLDMLAAAALPLGLLTVGAGLDPAGLRGSGWPVMVAAVAKLVAMPLLAALACRLLGVEGATAAVAVLFAALPVSASAYVLARRLGGDPVLMANTVTLQTLFAAVSMPAILVVFA